MNRTPFEITSEATGTVSGRRGSSIQLCRHTTLQAVSCPLVEHSILCGFVGHRREMIVSSLCFLRIARSDFLQCGLTSQLYTGFDRTVVSRPRLGLTDSFQGGLSVGHRIV